MAGSSALVECLLVLVLANAPSCQNIAAASTEISCQPVIINEAHFAQPSAHTCEGTCSGNKFCVQTSSEHEHSNISAVCRDRQLTSQEVFLVYHHCQSSVLPCRLEVVPGLLGPVTVKYRCLEDSRQIVDPCEEGNYIMTSVNFLYGYHRVVNTTSDVTCSCSLTKLNYSSHLLIKAVNAYSLQHVDNTLPEFIVEHNNKKERVNSFFPQDFIITTPTTNIVLTLTVSSDDRIGRMWVSVSQQGQGLAVRCLAVSGTIPIQTQTENFV